MTALSARSCRTARHITHAFIVACALIVALLWWHGMPDGGSMLLSLAGCALAVALADITTRRYLTA